MDSDTQPVQPAESPWNFDGADDIRNYYSDDMVRNQILMTMFPSPFTATEPSSNNPDMNGLDVMVILLRHFYLNLGSEWLAEIAKHEEKNPILRLAWCVLDDSTRSQRFQNAARTEIWSWLQRKQQIPPRLAFRDLAESGIMLDTIFQTEPFLLFRPRIMCQTEGDPEWRAVRYNTRHNAEDSCILWDGQKDLGEFVSSKFGIFSDSSDNKKYLYCSNKPAILQVHYTNVSANRRSFKDIAEIRVDGKNTFQDLKKPTNELQDAEVRITHYRLSCAIQLRDEGKVNDRDLIRRWDLSGRHLPDPAGFKEDWRIGLKGWQYRLYYCAMSDTYTPYQRAHLGLPETALRHPDWQENMELKGADMRAAREARAQKAGNAQRGL